MDIWDNGVWILCNINHDTQNSDILINTILIPHSIVSKQIHHLLPVVINQPPGKYPPPI